MEEENILSVDHLGLKRFYFSSKWLLPSVLGQCWRAHLRGAGPKLLAPCRGKGGEQELRSCCRVAATAQPLWPLSCCGASRAFWIPPLLAAGPGPRGVGTRRGCGCLSLIVTITRCGVGTTLPALSADPRGAGPMTLVPSERRATTSERQATGFVTCFKTHPAWSLLFHYPKSHRNHPAGSISHRQPDSFLVLY